MDSGCIVYTPHPDATPETQASALASTYRYLLNHHAKKEAAHPGGPNNAERRSNEIRAQDIIPR